MDTQCYIKINIVIIMIISFMQEAGFTIWVFCYIFIILLAIYYLILLIILLFCNYLKCYFST